MEALTLLLPNAAQLDTMNALLSVIATQIGSASGASSWRPMSQIVKMGLGESTFPVGYEATAEDADTGDKLVCRVLGHNHHVAADKNIKYTTTFGLKYTYKNSSGNRILEFSARQALYYAKAGLTAGTYHFTLPSGYDTAHGGGGTYSFTLTKPIPAGGSILFPWSTSGRPTNAKISTYENATATAAIESGITVTEGAEGTFLGTADGSTEDMNYAARCRIGSNNYGQGAIHQMLNSAAEAGAYWKPQTKFDCAPTWVNTVNGFMHGMPEDFLEAVQPVIVPCRTNGVYEVNSLDGTVLKPNQTYDIKAKFFTPSRGELFGTDNNSTVKDGTLLEYYKGLTDAERIMRNAEGIATSVWLRTPYATDCTSVSTMTSAGKTGSNGAYLTSSIYVLFAIG